MQSFGRKKGEERTREEEEESDGRKEEQEEGLKRRKRKRGGDLVVKGKEGNIPVKEEKKEPKELEGICAGLSPIPKSLRWPSSQLY